VAERRTWLGVSPMFKKHIHNFWTLHLLKCFRDIPRTLVEASVREVSNSLYDFVCNSRGESQWTCPQF
jgi:hypothetical protein